MADEPLGRMVIELGLDHSDFGKGLQGAKNEVKYNMAEMKSSLAVVGQSGKQFDILSAKAKGLSSVMMSQQRIVQELGKAYNNSFADGKATTQTGKLAAQLQNANAKLLSLQTQYKNNAGAMAKARVETTGFTGGLNKISKQAVETGTAMSHIGSSMTSKVSMPIAAGLAYATKSAVQFDSQIKSIGPLLTNGGAVTAKFKDQLDQMADSSKKWSTQYGVSTTEINNGMSELVRRGFTAKQTLGAMPAVLDATKASGEDMGTVMQATASIVEQFGLKEKSTAGTLKNTTMVTDALTYAANATASSFGDMSEAMKYVGPTASSVGLTVQQTAAAIGILSNRGIEGQKAGTGLRSILTSLVKPSKQATSAFKEMGLSTKDLQADSHNLPKLIDDIQNGTKGWTKAEKTRAIAQAFGKENQTAMNALLGAGSKQLRDMTKATEESGGATKKVADQMNQTSENQIKRLIESLKVLGIEIGQDVVPMLIPLVKKATEMVKGFSEMDDSTKKTIVKFALLVAAGGPVIGILGKITKGFGDIGGGIISVISKFAQWNAKSQALKDLTGQVTEGTKGLGSELKFMQGSASNGVTALSKLGTTTGALNGTVTTARTGFSLFGTSLTTAEAGAGVLGTSLTVAGAAVAGVGLAVAAGAVIWEGWGKEAYASAQRTDEWGSDIGKNAADAAGRMQDFESKASTALDNFGDNAKKNAKIVDKAFQDMANDSQKSIDKSLKNANNVANQIGGPAGAAIKAQAEKEHAANQKRVDDMQKTAQQVTEITANSAKTGEKLTADQSTTIANLQRKMAQDEIKTLGLKASQHKAILAAELGETDSMTKKQLASTAKAIGDSAYKEADLYNKQTGELHKAQQKGLITTAEMNAGLEALGKKHNSAMSELGEDLIRTEKKQGESNSDIMDDMMNKYGFTEKEAKAALAKYNSDLKEASGTAVKLTSGMSKAATKAAEDWNKMVLDPKTGKLKTNAQEEVNKAVKDKDKWNSMLLLIKQGKMSSNAAAMVGMAAVQAGKWDKLPLKEKQAMIRSKGGDDLAKLLEKGKEWGKLTTKEKQAIINAKGGADLLKVIMDTKTWNKLTVKEKQAVLKDNASPAMKQAGIGLKEWNGLTPQMKTVMAKAKGAQDVANGIKSVKDWNSLPEKEKSLIANDKGASKTVSKVTNDYKRYQDLPKNSVKNLTAKDNASKNADKAKISVDKFGRLKMPNPIGLKAKDEASGNAKKATKGVGDFNKTKTSTKTLKAKDNASGPINSAKNSGIKYNGLKMSTKTAKGKDSASGPFGNAKGSGDRYNGMTMVPKTAKGHDAASGPFGIAKGSADSFNGLTMIPKTVKGHDAASSVINGAIGVLKAWNALNPVTHFLTTVVRKVTGRATGTGPEGTDGGPIMVNDQPGPVFREALKYPGHPAFIPYGRNVILNDAPKGTQVIPANLTARMYNIPQLANGTISPNSSVLQASRVINDSIYSRKEVNADFPSTEFSVNKQNDTNGNQSKDLSPLILQMIGVETAVLQAIKDQGIFDLKGLYRRQAKDLSMGNFDGVN